MAPAEITELHIGGCNLPAGILVTRALTALILLPLLFILFCQPSFSHASEPSGPAEVWESYLNAGEAARRTLLLNSQEQIFLSPLEYTSFLAKVIGEADSDEVRLAVVSFLRDSLLYRSPTGQLLVCSWSANQESLAVANEAFIILVKLDSDGCNSTIIEVLRQQDIDFRWTRQALTYLFSRGNKGAADAMSLALDPTLSDVTRRQVLVKLPRHPAAMDFLESLMELTQQDNDTIAHSAARSLSTVGYNGAEFVELLSDWVQPEESIYARLTALEAVLRIGGADIVTPDMISHIATDNNVHVRSLAAEYISKFFPLTVDLLPILSILERDPHRDVRFEAREARNEVIELGGEAYKERMFSLLREAKGGHPPIHIIERMVWAFPESLEVKESILEFAKPDLGWHYTLELVALLLQMDLPNHEVVTILLRLYEEDGESFQVFSRAFVEDYGKLPLERHRTTTGQFSQNAIAALPELQKLTNHVDPFLASFARKAIDRIKETTPPK